MTDTANDKNKNGELIHIKVTSSVYEELIFKVKKTTLFEKIKEKYCERFGINKTDVRFLFDGDNIKDNQTPKDIGLEDGFSIDCIIEQKGGRIKLNIK